MPGPATQKERSREVQHGIHRRKRNEILAREANGVMLLITASDGPKWSEATFF